MTESEKNFFMELAYQEAEKAFALDEVPIGAIIVKDGEVVAKSHNLKESENCALFHAETVAIREACKKVENWWLEDCDLFVTLEPCAMCVGACINSRLRGVYFGAFDKKSGCMGSVLNLAEKGLFNHNLVCEGGILAEKCGKILSDFFAQKRKK